jgi:hypothetical protein
MSLEGKTAEEIAALAELAMQLSSDPKTRQGFLHLSKQANPTANIPEVDIPMQFRQVLDRGQKRLEELEKQVQEDRLEKSIEAKRRALITAGKASTKDLDAIEKIMVEKHIPDHETAAEFYALQQKSAEPTPDITMQKNLKESVQPQMDLKPFNGNINDWARATAKNTLDEIRKGQIKI